MITDLLYTWVDVQAALQNTVDEWPPALWSARAYWDGVAVEHAPGAREDVANWLANLFGPRWEGSAETPTIRLESASGAEPRSLLVHLEELEGQPPSGPARRTFRTPDTALRRKPWVAPKDQIKAKVFAWHSFKGGVGRTTTALAFARLLASSAGPGKVLLVDMDFEAPGITWMIETSRMGRPDIAMSDVLALVHGAPAGQIEPVLELIAERLRSTSPEGLYILPALRPHQREVHIRPEHLEAPGVLPLADVLAELASKLDASYVIADLRAGRSELAATLLLDSRVERVLVTTCGGQSIKGTAQMLEDIASTFPENDSNPPITVLVSQVSLPGQFDEARLELSNAAYDALRLARPDQEQMPLRFTAVDFNNGLRDLPLEWSTATERLEASLVLNERVPVDMTLPQWAGSETGRPIAAPRTAVTSVATPTTPVALSWDERRSRLHSFTRIMVVAEQDGDGAADVPVLPTVFLQRLAQAHRYQLPVAVMIGEKGAGKTFTFLQLVRHQTWARFTKAIAGSAEEAASMDSTVVPVLWPMNLREDSKRAIEALLGGGQRADAVQLAFNTRLREAKARANESFDWRTWWLKELAARIDKPFSELGTKSLAPGPAPLFIVDGLEELLPTLHSDPVEQRCLQALLQDVPAWLRSAASPLGLLTFVRSDYVRSALPQNVDQFLALYKPYELWWDHNEARRLVRWVARTSGALQGLDLPEDAVLLAVWGTRTGPGVASQAPMDAWVMDAMSTRNQAAASALKARDVIRFLAEASHRSLAKPSVTEGPLLDWRSILDALDEVGKAKVNELREQYPSIGTVLARIAALKGTHKVPFRYEELPVDEDRLALLTLEVNEIAFRERNEVWLIPLYRRGLGLELAPRRRERVFR